LKRDKKGIKPENESALPVLRDLGGGIRLNRKPKTCVRTAAKNGGQRQYQKD
jgi:hypothetical protein